LVLTLQNVYSSPVVLSNLTVDDGRRGFTITSAPTLPLTMNPGDTTTITVDFTPTVLGAAQDHISGSGLVSIDLTGTGVEASAADTPPTGSVDSAVGSYNGASTVAQYANLQMEGWAADAEDGSPVQRVDVLMDGAKVGSATLGSTRQDVARAYNRPDWAQSGWSFEFNLGSRSTGVHLVSAVAYDSQGLAGTLFSPRNITIVSDTPPTGSVDQAVNVANLSTTIPQGGVLMALGWAADNEDGSPVHEVDVYIDGNPVGLATLGYTRQDVATAYNRPAWAQSGWQLNYNIGTMPVGTHTVTALAVDSQGAFFGLAGAQQFTVVAGP
jgi:hypothetical protein